MGFCDINHDAEKKTARKKAIKELKIIDFLESKTERSKYYDKKEKQTFITTQLLL